MLDNLPDNILLNHTHQLNEVLLFMFKKVTEQEVGKPCRVVQNDVKHNFYVCNFYTVDKLCQDA